MYINFKTAFAMISKKKIQNILIGLVIVVVATMLYISISMLNQTSQFNTMYDRANAAESLILLPIKDVNIKKITSWYENQDDVEKALAYPSILTNISYKNLNETKIDSILLSEFIVDDNINLLYKNETTIIDIPKGNDMIINYNFAKNRGLEIGDKIVYKYGEENFEFEIVSIAVDPQFSNSFLSPSRCFIAPGFFNENNIEYDMVTIQIKYFDINITDDISLYEEFKLENPTVLGAIFIGYNSIKTSYNIIMSLISVILMTISILVFFVVIFIIKSTVKNYITQQYKQIGVKKALGYSNKQIRNSLLLVFCTVGLIAATIGSFLGVPVRSIINSGISYDIQVGIASSIDIFILITIALVEFLVIVFTVIITRKINNVKPVQAIKYGMPESSISINKFSIISKRNRPLSVLLAFKQVMSNKKKTISYTLLITILIYLALVISNTGSTLKNSKHLASHLLGNKIGDFTVIVDSNRDANEVKKELESLEEVNNVIINKLSIEDSTILKDGSTQSISRIELYGDAPEDFVMMSKGLQPHSDNEVIISTDVSEKTGKTIGDYININTAGEDRIYLITGVFKTIVSSGNAYIIMNENVPENINSQNVIYWAYTDLKTINIDDLDRTAKDLLGNDTTVSEFDTNIKTMISSLDTLPMVIQLLLFVFLSISGIIILNFTIMNINNSIKVYGIMKATGFSNGFITRMIVIKGVMITSFGIIVGLVLNALTINAIMNGIFMVTPFSSVSLPVLFNIKSSIVLAVLFITITIIASIIPSKKIGKISPKQLISE